MNIIKKLIICSLIILASCSKQEKDISKVIEGDDLEIQMIKSYNEGVEALEKGDVLFASKKFNQAELLFPQSPWAAKSSLMAAYAY